MSTTIGNPGYETLKEALTEHYRVDALRALAKMVCDKVPSRKADIINAICRAMLSLNLKSHYDDLDFIEKAAVQEACLRRGGN